MLTVEFERIRDGKCPFFFFFFLIPYLEKKEITRILKNADTAEKEKAYFLVELETRARVFNARFDPVSRARRGFISLRRQTQRVLPPIFVYFRGNARRLVAERREDTGLSGQPRSESLGRALRTPFKNFNFSPPSPAINYSRNKRGRTTHGANARSLNYFRTPLKLCR